MVGGMRVKELGELFANGERMGSEVDLGIDGNYGSDDSADFNDVKIQMKEAGFSPDIMLDNSESDAMYTQH
jgi:hypothetical protein